MFPAIGERLRTLPEALPKFAVTSAGSPSSIVGIAALVLLSGLGLVLYVVRFVRRPRAT